jgi:hypothetical protein
MSEETQHTESSNSPPEAPRAPRGRPGATLVREEESRTHRGATVTIREWWHRAKGQAPYRFVEARSGSGLLGEYTTAVRGNAAIVFEAFLAGVYDLSTPLADLPPGLSRAMGRGWLKAADGRCNSTTHGHIAGAKGCPHVPGDLLKLATAPAVYAGLRGANTVSSEEAARDGGSLDEAGFVSPEAVPA